MNSNLDKSALDPAADYRPDLLEGMTIAPPPPAQEPMGFFTDSTLCIGCKACEVACKQWNDLPSDGMEWTGRSYDNTTHLSATTWRHVSFTEQVKPGNAVVRAAHRLDRGTREDGASGGPDTAMDDVHWMFNSDVCKHCTVAPCQEACPTGALIRNEFDDVYVQADVCNGCGYCVVACPFGVLGRSESDGAVHKCTLCYDRQKDGIEPACAKSCPTDSIQFGPVSQLRETARDRLAAVRAKGQPQAYLYGCDDAGEYKRLNAFFLLTDEPAAYNLPPAPRRPSAHMLERYAWSALTGLALTVAGAIALAQSRGEGRPPSGPRNDGLRSSVAERRGFSRSDAIKEDGASAGPDTAHR